MTLIPTPGILALSDGRWIGMADNYHEGPARYCRRCEVATPEPRCWRCGRFTTKTRPPVWDSMKQNHDGASREARELAEVIHVRSRTGNEADVELEVAWG